MKKYSPHEHSNNDWIGELPVDWKVKKLKYCSELNRLSLNENTDPNYEIQYIDIGNVNINGLVAPPLKMFFCDAPSRARRIVRNGDTIVSTVRTYLMAIAYMDLKSVNTIASTGFAVITPTREILPKYLYYLLISQKVIDTINSLSKGVSYPAIDSLDLANIRLSFPSKISEQERMVNYLDIKTQQIDTIISKKQKMIGLLKEERIAIIDQAVTRGIVPNSEIKDSGVEYLGKIPANWEVKKLKYVIKGRLKYGANETAELEDKSLPRYIRITDFDEDGKLREDTFKSLTLDKAKDYYLEDGDVLFARSGATVGKTFQFKNYRGLACFAGYLIKATPLTEVILSDFLYFITKSNYFDNWKNSIFIQATIQNIGANKYSLFNVPIPPLDEQKEIIAYINDENCKLDKTIAKIQKEIDLLHEYRIALISEVVTGKIDVRNEVVSWI